MTVERVTLHIPGITHPQKLVHISDTHIAFPSDTDDETDTEAIIDRTKAWSANGKTPVEAFEEIMADAEVKNADGLIITGDGIDTLTKGSLDYMVKVKSSFRGKFIYVMGNHDSGHHLKKLDYDESVSKLMPLFSDEPDFHAERFDGFTVVSLNAFSGSVSVNQLSKLKAVAKEGRPVILATHRPLFTDKTSELIDTEFWLGAQSHYLLGIPGSDATTNEFSDYIKSDESNVVAYLCGHIHLSHSSEFAPERYQYSAGTGFGGFVRIIDIVS